MLMIGRVMVQKLSGHGCGDAAAAARLLVQEKQVIVHSANGVKKALLSRDLDRLAR
jgi:N-acetylmuramoyl-L-alanine amidase